MEIWFTATEKFDKYDSGWSKYIQWSQLHQLTEVVSLDSSLCPSIFNELRGEDWQHNIHAHFGTNYFRDLDYLIRRVQDKMISANILAVVFEPDSDPAKIFINDKFIFCGYDLIEVGGGTSALINCGGFEMAFNNTDISQNGLLTDYVFAKNVQERLRQNYPNESHANCDLWALWRLSDVISAPPPSEMAHQSDVTPIWKPKPRIREIGQITYNEKWNLTPQIDDLLRELVKFGVDIYSTRGGSDYTILVPPNLSREQQDEVDRLMHKLGKEVNGKLDYVDWYPHGWKFRIEPQKGSRS